MKKLSEVIESYRVDRPDEWTMDMMKEKAEKIEAERDALAAQLGLLQLAVLSAVQKISGGQTKADLRDAYDATPQQCLAEVKAEAGRAGYLQGHMDAGGINNEWSAKRSERFAEQYAAKIRNTGTWLRDENVNGGKRQGGEK